MFKRIFNILFAFINNIFNTIERGSPMTMLAAEKEKTLKEINKINVILSESYALIEKFKRDVVEYKKIKEENIKITKFHIKNNDNEKAALYAKEIKNIDIKINNNDEQIELMGKQMEELNDNKKRMKMDINYKIGKIKQLYLETEMVETKNKMYNINTNLSNECLANENLNKIEEILIERKDKALGYSKLVLKDEPIIDVEETNKIIDEFKIKYEK
jgi:hypothetical protein